ncbi:MAG: acyltransferase family protein [Lachnospiraceae bacterium]|nr:acyltransferase family protein [Lachnospiraceae bacterium]
MGQPGVRSKSNKKFMLLSAVGILMVVDHHTWITFNLFGDYIPYNSFFMPMFVFISGYFNKIDENAKLPGYILKKARTLLIPYVGISLMVFAIQWLINLFKTGEVMAVPSGYLLYVLERVVTIGSSVSIATPMWFVISLFSVLVIYAVLKKLMYRIWNSYVMLVLFCCMHVASVYLAKTLPEETLTPLLIPLKCMFFIPFIEMGIIYRDHLEAKHGSLSGGRKLLLMLILLLINTARSIYLPDAYDMAFDSIGEMSGFTSPFIVTPLISSVVGILFWLTLIDMAGSALYESRFVNYMSCNTFWIMGLHIAFFNIVNCVLLTIHEHIMPLLYFDAEYFRESEWYYWEISPAFKLVYLTAGILGPLALKKIYDTVRGGNKK